MASIFELKEKARKERRRIVLPEGHDLRVIEAASKLAEERIADVILVGRRSDIEADAKKNSWDLKNIEILESGAHPKLDDMVTALYERRKHRGMTEDDARKIILNDPLYFAAMLTRFHLADGYVAGASHKTSDVARSAIYCCEIDKNIGVVSSSFLIEVKECPFGEDGLFIFGDCGIIPYPTAEQLSAIAISCGTLMEQLFDVKARVALLSYSTKGSAKGGTIDVIRNALEIINKKAPQLSVDGELQADAAIVPEVAAIKCGGSKVGGKANVLVFPNLDSGNIGYKLVQRLAGARVVGPLLHGITRPASDLSRGCGIDEIIDAVAVTAVRAQYL